MICTDYFFLHEVRPSSVTSGWFKSKSSCKVQTMSCKSTPVHTGRKGIHFYFKPSSCPHRPWNGLGFFFKREAPSFSHFRSTLSFYSFSNYSDSVWALCAATCESATPEGILCRLQPLPLHRHCVWFVVSFSTWTTMVAYK